jgi:hypothetical protein
MDYLEKTKRCIKPWRRHFLNFRNQRNKNNACWKKEKLSGWEKTLQRRRERRVLLVDSVGEFVPGNRNLLKKASRHLL